MDRETLHERCRTEGLSIMQDVFDIILDRGEVTVEGVMAWLDEFPGDVQDVYEDFIVRGINNLSDALGGS